MSVFMPNTQLNAPPDFLSFAICANTFSNVRPYTKACRRVEPLEVLEE
jgi:hypothetical protein